MPGMTNSISYFEICGPAALGASALADFYRDALGVDSNPHPQDPSFFHVDGTGGGSAGVIYAGPVGFDAEVFAVPYIQVDDIDATADAVVAAGGTVLTAPHAHGPTRAAHIADPAGNRIGIFTGNPS